MSGFNAVTETGFFRCHYRRKAPRPTRTSQLWRKKVWKTAGILTDSRNCWLYEFQASNFFADYWLRMLCFFCLCRLMNYTLTRAGMIRVSCVFVLRSIQFSVVAVLMRTSVWKVRFVINNMFSETSGILILCVLNSLYTPHCFCCPTQPLWKKYDVAPKQRSCVTLGDIRRLQTSRPCNQK